MTFDEELTKPEENGENEHDYAEKETKEEPISVEVRLITPKKTLKKKIRSKKLPRRSYEVLVENVSEIETCDQNHALEALCNDKQWEAKSKEEK